MRPARMCCESGRATGGANGGSAAVPRLGLGTQLLGFAEQTGRSLGKRGMSVIVSDANLGARRLYERCGFREIAARTMVKDEWRSEGRNWVLLTKAL